MNRYGCTDEQLAFLRRIGREMKAAGCSSSRTPLGAFALHHVGAQRRGIEWKLTLWEWWTIWDRSGKWAMRGRRHGEYVLCRKGDIGPYAVGNVFIGLAVDNCSIKRTKISGLPRGVSVILGKRPYYFTRCCINGKPTHIGTFKTPEEAHAAYLVARNGLQTSEQAA